MRKEQRSRARRSYTSKKKRGGAATQADSLLSSKVAKLSLGPLCSPAPTIQKAGQQAQRPCSNAVQANAAY